MKKHFLPFILCVFSFTLKAQCGFTITGTVINATSNPACNGHVYLSVSGGSGPFTYFWDTGDTTSYLNNACGGIHKCYVRDVNNCLDSISKQVYVTGSPLINLYNPTQPSCNSCNGQMNVSNNGIPGQLTYLWNTGQTTYSINNVCSGQIYSVTVTDSWGNTYQDSMSVIGVLSVTQQWPSDACNQCHGTISLTPFNGTPPFTYNWDAAVITHHPGTNTSTAMVNNMCLGEVYSCYITDSSGCSFSTGYIQITGDSGSTLAGVGIVIDSVINSSCCFLNDGSVITHLTGGAGSTYNYSWAARNTGCGSIGFPVFTDFYHTIASTDDIYNTSNGEYKLFVSDSTGHCAVSNVINVNVVGSNCGTISGRVTFDSNSDCLSQASESGVIGKKITIGSGYPFTFTNNTGNYYFSNLGYGNTVINQVNNLTLISGSCNNNVNVTTSASSLTVNFQDSVPSTLANDISLSMCVANVVPGFDDEVLIWLRNNNPNAASDGTLYLVLPSDLSYVSSVPAISSQNSDTLFWTYTNLSFNYLTSMFNVKFHTSASTVLGTVETFCAGAVLNSVPDIDLSNNVRCINRVATGSFDPNEKLVDPRGEGASGNITVEDSMLIYTIMFQNTGTGSAVNIVVTDTISDNVNLQTFEMIGSSNNYSFQIKPNNKAEWKFSNIMLPDSGSNEPSSHGWIQYSVKLKEGLLPGTKIENRANIYFDFNPPVITNTALNTLTSPAKVFAIDTFEVKFYPNPTNGNIQFRSDVLIDKVIVYNEMGQIVKTLQEKTSSGQVNLSALPDGIYNLSFRSSLELINKRVVLIKN